MSCQEKLYFETPLLESNVLSEILGTKVFLKMENMHQTGSFKQRGISHLCQEAISKGAKKLVGSSGGSAGLATAFVGRKFGIDVKVIVPETTSVEVQMKLKKEGAEVEIFGDNWNMADVRARTIASEDPGNFYIHPFDHPTVWAGHATMVHEIAAKLRTSFPNTSEISVVPSVVVASVGGGGLACGIIEGMADVGWENVPLVAMETKGTDCFNKSVLAGKKVVLPGITSIAICLGSVEVTQRLLDLSEERTVISKVVSDKEAVNACLRFADDHRVLVDPACGASLAAVYFGVIKGLQEEGVIGKEGPAIVIVCGGIDVNLAKIASKWNAFK